MLFKGRPVSRRPRRSSVATNSVVSKKETKGDLEINNKGAQKGAPMNTKQTPRMPKQHRQVRHIKRSGQVLPANLGARDKTNKPESKTALDSFIDSMDTIAQSKEGVKRQSFKTSSAEQKFHFEKNTSNQSQPKKKPPRKPRHHDRQRRDFRQSGKRDFESKPRDEDVKKLSLPQEMQKPADSLRIYPLGGQEEVGRNCTVFEYGSDIIILDMGIQFPDEDMPGIDYIIPNAASLEQKKKNIRAVIFSHGHLDHIGAAPMMLERLGNPLIIGRNLTIALVKHRQEDYKKGSTGKLKTLIINSIGQKITLGKFKISFFRVEHSIMDAVGIVIETPHGTVIHPGDWNLESDPMEGETITYEHLAKLPSPRILMLESLGATTNKVRVPVKTTQANLQKLIAEAPGRIIIGTFASQVERIKSLLEYAEQSGKKVALDGYSMKINVKISQELGYIKIHKNTLIPVEQIHNYPDNKIIVLCTGAQGESNAVFSRIVNGSHKFITINKTDTVVFSSSVIPGNEATIQKLKDQIYRLTERVVHSETMDIHSSGHSNREDIKAIINQIKPDYFIPVYAYFYMLVEAKKLAMTDGFKPENIFVLENGRVIEFDRGRPRLLKERVNTDYIMVDGLGVGDITDVVLRDRQVMAEDGMIVVIATIYSKNGQMVGNPDIISRGFIYMKDNKDLIEATRKKVREIVETGDTRTKADENFIKNKLRNDLGQFLAQKTQKRPMVLPVIIKV